MPHEEGASASPLYAWGQLQRAIDRAQSSGDRASRARASAKADAWQRVLSGMAAGELRVGSRTPVADTPSWVTLEVLTGGFATGRYLAEQPVDEQEAELLSSAAQAGAGSTPREQLNLWFLSDAGQELLTEALSSGRFRVDVPEESALLVVTWLMQHERYEQALDLVGVMRPLMHRLKFSPRLVESSRPAGSLVRLRTVAQVAAPLKEAETNAQITAMLATLRVWDPLYDELVALWCSTVEGDLPVLEGTSGGTRVAGGWPCKVWPSDWSARREQWLSEFHAASERTPFQGRHAHARSNFTRLKAALERCPENSADLSAAEVGWLRRAVANTITRHGAPGSERRAALRAAQRVIAARPTHAALAHALAARLDRFPGDGGLPFLDPLAAEFTAAEAPEIPEGTAVPAHLLAKVERALEAPIEELVDRGVITSGEVLAMVLPQISSQALAMNVNDPVLAGVLAQTYTAFRRRRSLLLLNLEHQVRIEELPWVAAVESFRSHQQDAVLAARRTLTETTLLALSAFPETILPNPLVREMGALATAAQLQLPLVEEVAADIFMGTFTTKWRRSAVLASELLTGSLYARYYALPTPSVWAAQAPQRSKWTRRWGKETAEDFAALCKERAREVDGDGSGSFVARNGAVLEQSQILTSHNFIQLITALELRDRVALMAPELAAECLRWISRRHLQPQHDWRAQLQMIKNTAYGLRQAILFLSLCDDATQRRISAEWADAIATEPRLSALVPVAQGLRHVVVDGGSFDALGRAYNGGPGRRFLGWSVGRHWLLGTRGR